MYAWAIVRRADDSLNLATASSLRSNKAADRNRYPRRCVHPLDDTRATACQKQRHDGSWGRRNDTQVRRKNNGQTTPSLHRTCHRCRDEASSSGITPCDAVVTFHVVARTRDVRPATVSSVQHRADLERPR